MKTALTLLIALLLGPLAAPGGNAVTSAEPRNDHATAEVLPDGTVVLRVKGMTPQRVVPEFTVLTCDRDPKIHRNASHPNYPIAPRTAVRWLSVSEPAEELNAWLASPAMKQAVGLAARVLGEPGARTWEYRDASGKEVVRVTGRSADGTTRPLAVGDKIVVRAAQARFQGNCVQWEFPDNDRFRLSAELRLPPADGDCSLTLELTPKREAFYSVAFTGAPSVARAAMLPAPQECAGRNLRQGDFVFSEADLKLPRAQTVTHEGCVALVVDPAECRFRLPGLDDSRFGLMLRFAGDTAQPVVLAPLLGGAESRRKAGQTWKFALRIVVRGGDWTETHRHIAEKIHGLSDHRDNSGPGSLNGALERILDFLADRNGRNYALWSDEQKYYDYFTDQTGVFKPFSPLYGLSAAIITDDEDFYRRRARPAVEFALSRKYNLFAPYEGIYRAIVKSAARDVGGPYVGYAQLVALYEMFQRRPPVLLDLAEAKGCNPKAIADQLARWRLSADRAALDAAKKAAEALVRSEHLDSEAALFDLLDLYAATKAPVALRGAVASAYCKTADLNLYPRPPDGNVTVDAGGFAAVHKHSFGRHKNVWGFLEPEPVPCPEQTVPAWRVSRLGLSSPAYPMEYWMNAHAALLRASAISGDVFLRTVARCGMVGRFGSYPGDNRSVASLISERPEAVERPPWLWNFATVNPGHAWDFVGAIIDWLVTDAFERSRGAIDFPSVSAAGSGFRVGIYGSAAGEFYGERGVYLWMPRGLLHCDSRQLDWIAARGKGSLYLAFMNPSARAERADVVVSGVLAECRSEAARCWIDNRPVPPPTVSENRLSIFVPAKGIVALAIPAKVKPRFQAKLYGADAPALGSQSYDRCHTPFGEVHALLLTAGRGLTSAFVYAEAKPENVIAARLWWRQGREAWRQQTDAIYPYEFSPELTADAGDFHCVFEVENAQGEMQRSRLVTLQLGDVRSEPPANDAPPSVPLPVGLGRTARESLVLAVSDDFLAYLKTASNPQKLGWTNQHFFPYSTPLGRRIAWGLPIWDKALFAKGCTEAEADAQFRRELEYAAVETDAILKKRTPPATIGGLSNRQREWLLDFALTETASRIPETVIHAILADDLRQLARDHRYVRYAGPAPDHPRNRAFVDRWKLRDIAKQDELRKEPSP
jgi:hypothetical protein